MERIRQFVARAPRRARDRAASLVEYALLMALVAVVCIAAVTKLGGATGGSAESSADAIAGESDDQGPCADGYHVGTASHGGEVPQYCHRDGSATDAEGFHLEYYALS